MSCKLKKYLAIGLVAVSAVACSPTQVSLFHSLPPEQQVQIVKGMGSSADCYEAIDKHFSGDKDRFKTIVKRESKGDPRAQNKSSSAAGCAQLLKIHAPRFERVGCSWAQRYESDCNIKAADNLYREQGLRPWKLTNY